MTKRHLSLTVESDIYQEIKRRIPEGKVSPLVDSLLREYLKRVKDQELKEAYQRTAKSKEMQEEDEVWEGTVEDGIEDE